MGRGTAVTKLVVEGSLDVPAPAQPLTTDEALVIAEQERPDIISLRKQITRAETGLRVERTKAFPSVTPSLGYSDQYQRHVSGVPDAPSYQASLVVLPPIFDRNQGNIAKAESVLVQSRLYLQAQLVQLRADVEQATNDFRKAQINVTATGPEQLKTAQSVRDRTEAAYKTGGKTLLEVLDAERAYRDTYRTYIMNQSDYWHTLHQLNATMGKQVLR